MKSLFILAFLPLLSLGYSDLFMDYLYQPPQNLNDGLETGTLEEVGIDNQLVINAASLIQDEKYGEVHSMLIYPCPITST